MHRNAIRLIPAVFNSRQSLYIQRNKTPFALLIDAKAATEAGHRFYMTPNDVVLCDGGMDGLIEPEYILGVFDFDMACPQDGFSRLCINAARDGVRPVPPHTGSNDDIPKNLPRLEDVDYRVLSREDRNTPKETSTEEKRPGLKSNIAAKYGPLSLTSSEDVTEGTAASGPVLRPRKERSPPPPPGSSSKPVSVFSSEAFRPSSRASRKRFATDTKPKASPTSSKMPRKSADGLESNDPQDWPADHGDSCGSSIPAVSPPLGPQPVPQISEDQFEELKQLVIDTTHSFLQIR